MIPPKRSAQFVWRMEAVLDLYEEPYDEKRPTICFDERPCQLLAEVRKPLPVRPGHPERRDNEYERRGMAHVLMAFEPLTGWRRAFVTERRRGREFAEEVRHLAEEVYPARREDPPGMRQPLHPLGGGLLRGVPAGEGSPVSEADRVLLHAGARLVAEHGGDRTLSFGQAVSQTKIAGHRILAARGESMAQRAQSVGDERGLALHHRRRPDEATQALSIH